MRKGYQEASGAQRIEVICCVPALRPWTDHSFSLPQFPFLGNKNSHFCQDCHEEQKMCVSFLILNWHYEEVGCCKSFLLWVSHSDGNGCCMDWLIP